VRTNLVVTRSIADRVSLVTRPAGPGPSPTTTTFGLSSRADADVSRDFVAAAVFTAMSALRHS